MSESVVKPRIAGKTAIVVGLKSEAALLKSGPARQVLCAASDPDRARLFIDRMIADGATRCLSFGLAGGLEPGLPSGTAIIADHVTTGAETLHCDSAWVKACAAALPAAHVGGLWGSEQIIARPSAKALLYQASHCLACDMESHIVARAARRAGLPFLALRVICDPAEMALPAAALLPLRDNGMPDLAAILRDIIRHPAQLPGLLRLAGHNRRAMRSLAAAAAAIEAT